MTDNKDKFTESLKILNKAFKKFLKEIGILKKNDFVSKWKLIEASKKYFKEKGFSKKNNGWFREIGSVILCFNIRTSQWNPDDYYVNVGVVIKGIDKIPKTALGNWHISQRIDNIGKSCEDIIDESYYWLLKHESIDYLLMLSRMGYNERLPVIMTIDECDFPD